MSSSQIVVISSIDWDAAWQRHQIFAAQFAAAGHEVFFVENMGFRDPGLADLSRVWARLKRITSPASVGAANRVSKNLRVIPPKVLPPTKGLFRTLNRSLFLPGVAAQLRAAGLKPGATVICYHATANTLGLIDLIAPGKVVYDCASNFRAIKGGPKDLLALERALLDKADLVATDSDFLFQQKRAEHGNVVQVHQGVADRFFQAKPAELAFKRLCSYGSWVPDLDGDYPLALAEAGFNVTISGFIRAPVPSHPRITALGPVELATLVDRLENFDVFLLPHKINEFTKAVIPAKLYECMALGRPIIATALPSLVPLANQGLLYVGKTPQDWVRIAQDLPRTETPELLARRVALAREHTHSREFERLTKAVSEI